MNRRRDDNDYDDDRSHRGNGRRGQSSRYDHEDQDDRRGRHMPERDEYGRFVSEDEDNRRHYSDNSGYSSSSGRGRTSHREDDYNDREDYDRGGRSQWRGGNSGGRGFASMDPEEQHEIARRGGEASARMQSRDEYGQFDGYGRGQSSSRSRSENDYYDDEDDRFRGGNISGNNGGNRRRGFATMDPERRREIASRGGRASWQSR